ncbi:uncharacterized protein VTP21DRAFT_10839 [Calcarisporiella thermophila]|uniref:uncharacterized protein n=1 Tax=Calcarisporiella thermophila TaxID=911321 RepID=UPI0037439AA0
MSEGKDEKLARPALESASEKEEHTHEGGELQTRTHEYSTEQLENGGEPLESHLADQSGELIGEEEPFRLTTRVFLAYICLCLLIFVASLDDYIFAASLPTISSVFNAASKIGTLGTANFLVQTASQPLYAKLSDKAGRKETLMLSLLFFIIGTAISGKSENMDMLIVGRCITALGNTGIDVNVLVIISDIFPLLHRGKWLSYFETIYVITVGIGPVIGGSLVEKGEWRWCFYLQLPICVLILIAVYFLIENRKRKTRTQLKDLLNIDWAGNLVLLISTICLLLGLNWGGQGLPWSSPTIIALLVVGIVLAAVFVLIEHKFAKDPTVPMRLLKIRNVASGYATIFLFAFTSMGLFYFLPMYFQIAKSYSATVAGIQQLAYNAAAVLSSILGGIAVAATHEYRLYVHVGLAIYAVGMGLTILMNQNSHAAEIVAYQAIIGFGGGFCTCALLVGIQAAVYQEDIAIITTLFSFFKSIGSTLGTSIFSAIWLATVRNSILSSVPAGTPEDLVEKAQNSVQYILNLPPDLKPIVVQAYVNAMRILAILATVGAGLVFLACLPLQRYRLKESIGGAPEKLDSEEGHSEWSLIRRLFRIKNNVH